MLTTLVTTELATDWLAVIATWQVLLEYYQYTPLVDFGLVAFLCVIKNGMMCAISTKSRRK